MTDKCNSSNSKLLMDVWLKDVVCLWLEWVLNIVWICNLRKWCIKCKLSVWKCLPVVVIVSLCIYILISDILNLNPRWMSLAVYLKSTTIWFLSLLQCLVHANYYYILTPARKTQLKKKKYIQLSKKGIILGH